jgi:hypothetical protein
VGRRHLIYAQKENKMAKSKRFLIVILVLMGLLGSLVGGVAAKEDSSLLRFVHVFPGLTAVDIYINDNLSVEGLEYGQASTYLNAPADELSLRVTLQGLTTTLWQQTAVLPQEEVVTMVAGSGLTWAALAGGIRAPPHRDRAPRVLPRVSDPAEGAWCGLSHGSPPPLAPVHPAASDSPGPVRGDAGGARLLL